MQRKQNMLQMNAVSHEIKTNKENSNILFHQELKVTPVK
jgi:hypothetical protein